MNDSPFLFHNAFKAIVKKKSYMVEGEIKRVKEFILCLLPHLVDNERKSFVMPNTTTEGKEMRENVRANMCKGNVGKEVAEANLAPPSNFFTLTTIHNTPKKSTRPLFDKREESKN